RQCGVRWPKSIVRRSWFAPPTDEFIKNDGDRADRDEGIGQVEDGEGPAWRVEQDVVDDMAVDGPVDEVAKRAADDQGKTDAGENLAGCRFGCQIEHE